MRIIRRPSKPAPPKETPVPITSRTYAFLSDEGAPKSAAVLEAARVVARCRELVTAPDTAQHASGNQPIELVKLTAAAHRLVLEAAAFGDALDRNAAAEAEAAAASLEAAWIAGTTHPAPAPPVPEMEEPGPVGRPRIGSLVHRWDELNGKCFPAFVVEIYGGAPNSATAVTAESPYLRLVDAGEGGQRMNARWIAKPRKDTQPGFRAPIVSYHRGIPSECPCWTK
jgi:hypothetical protein